MVGHVASQEAQKLSEQRVVNFSARNAAEQQLAAGVDVGLDLAALTELQGARQGLRQGDWVAVAQCEFHVGAGRHGALRQRRGCLTGNASALFS